MLAVMAGYFRLHRDRSFSVSTVQPSLDENPAENGGSQERKPPMPRHPSRLVAHGRHEDGHWQDAEAGCPSEGPPRDSAQARRLIHKVERDHRQETGKEDHMPRVLARPIVEPPPASAGPPSIHDRATEHPPT